MRSRFLDSSLFHIVVGVVAGVVIIAAFLAALGLSSWLVFGLLAVLLRIHPALGFAYSLSLLAVALVLVVRDCRKAASRGA